MRRFLIAIVLLLCLATALLAIDVTRFLHAPLANTAATTVMIKPGTSFRAVVDLLADKGVLDNQRKRIYFMAYARYVHKADGIKSGEYRVPAGQTPAQLLALLTSGKTIKYKITFIEGWTFAQMRAAVAANDVLEHTLADEDDAHIMAALGHADEKAEGRFMPDTYFFPRGTTDLSIYKRAYAAMQTFLDRAWANRAKDDIAVDTPYQALILASIIEKETAVADERKRIAGVFTRRLKKGMRLQTDPSVIYGIPDFDGNLTRKNLRTDTPYNTYLHTGLPPTPIALPSRAAIVAALHPAAGKALYFVSKGDGTHQFSSTLSEHNRAVRKYQLH